VQGETIKEVKMKGFTMFATAVFVAIFILTGTHINAQLPTMLVPNLSVREVSSGLVTPTAIAFLGENDMLVLEKNTGMIKRVVDGEVQATVLDLAVNNASERGLLGIAVHPNFPSNKGVYLFWSCRADPPPVTSPFFPTVNDCSDTNMFGADTGDILAAPLLGNRVDRFEWNGTILTYDFNLIELRSFQHDAAPIPAGQGDETQPARANHDGGPLAFGPDGKLYVMFGDTGRRSQLQNLPSGPTMTGLGTPVPDDQFGGPEPGNAHFTGVVLRLNDDGGAPADNPFFALGAATGGQIGANLQKVYAYGIRNSFGMAFDPESGNLWDQENGEDAFDEINLVEPGFNSGWIQLIGPSSRVPEYRQIETTSLNNETFPNLQQLRWGPERIATTETEALSRLFVLPGSHYSDPEFSWKYVVPPAGIGFMKGRGIGPQYKGDLFVGLSVTNVLGGAIFHFNLAGNRKKIGVDDPRLDDRVADNSTFYDLSESEDLFFGADFGVVTDIKTAPNGNLYVVSLSKGTVFEIFSQKKQRLIKLSAELTGDQEVPGPGDPDGTGKATFWLNPGEGRICFNLNVSGIEPATAAHIHRGIAGVSGPVVVSLTAPTSGASSGCTSATAAVIGEIRSNPAGFYTNVHNTPFQDGAIRGQLVNN
jgi:aldose sugar dehydrogenase